MHGHMNVKQTILDRGRVNKFGAVFSCTILLILKTKPLFKNNFHLLRTPFHEERNKERNCATLQYTKRQSNFTHGTAFGLRLVINSATETNRTAPSFKLFVI